MREQLKRRKDFFWYDFRVQPTVKCPPVLRVGVEAGEFLHCAVDRKEGGRDWGPGIICSDAAPGTYASRSLGLLKFLGSARAAPPAAVALAHHLVEDILGSRQDCVFRACHELSCVRASSSGFQGHGPLSLGCPWSGTVHCSLLGAPTSGCADS